ncbi:MAG: chemotaxis protein CheB [Pseudomonadota bacterium]|nr:chemotaxis protein CheB [Pseudomonadota bacterium]
MLIASSTGGPTALLTVLEGLSPSVTASILIGQHMPPAFTAALA